MERKTVLWIVIAVLLVVVIYVTFFTGSSGTGQAVAATGQVAKTAASSGMVGGC